MTEAYQGMREDLPVKIIFERYLWVEPKIKGEGWFALGTEEICIKSLMPGH